MEQSISLFYKGTWYEISITKTNSHKYIWYYKYKYIDIKHINGLVQDCSNPIANTL